MFCISQYKVDTNYINNDHIPLSTSILCQQKLEKDETKKKHPSLVDYHNSYSKMSERGTQKSSKLAYQISQIDTSIFSSSFSIQRSQYVQ